MSYYTLPTSLEVCGMEYEIRTDYRTVLDIFMALDDRELDDSERGEIVLGILYPAFYAGDMPQAHWDTALKQAIWFLNCGETEKQTKKQLKLMDWKQDFAYIIAPINRVAGCEVRSVEYMHWWTFMGYYDEIGDCMFAQIVGIRKKLKTGKKLDKDEQEWYKNNRSLVDIKAKYTESENETFNKVLGI